MRTCDKLLTEWQERKNTNSHAENLQAIQKSAPQRSQQRTSAENRNFSTSRDDLCVSGHRDYRPFSPEKAKFLGERSGMFADARLGVGRGRIQTHMPKPTGHPTIGTSKVPAGRIRNLCLCGPAGPSASHLQLPKRPRPRRT